jgi:flagellar motor switch protein FliN/FliY
MILQEPVMLEPNVPEAHQWAVEEWARQLTKVLESMTGEAPDVTFAAHSLSAPDTDPPQKELLWWAQPFNLGPESMIWAGVADTGWRQIGSRVLSSTGVEDGDPESIRRTYLEILQQVLWGMAGALSGRAGKEVSCLQGQHAAPPAAMDSSYSFEIHLNGLMVPMLAVFSPSLGVQAEAPKEDTPERVEQALAKTAVPYPTKPNSIDLLLDVELPVSVSFGRAQLPLKDVIKLTTGSIVELNRAVSEPVDVIVNNCVIARGEVVVVEGNFGIRIRQVVSRQERLRTLY